MLRLAVLLVGLLVPAAYAARTKICGPPYVDVVIMIDNSKSMSTSLYATQASFVDKLQDALFTFGQSNRVWLYKFDTVPQLIKSQATSKFAWTKTYTPSGATDHYDAMSTGYDVLTSWRSDKTRKPVYVLVTDGQPHKVSCGTVSSCSYSACQFSGCSSKCGSNARFGSSNYCSSVPSGKVGKYCSRHCHEACLCSVQEANRLKSAGIHIVTVGITEALDAGEAETNAYMLSNGYASSPSDHHAITSFSSLTSTITVDRIMDSICSQVASSPTFPPTFPPTRYPTNAPPPTSYPTNAPPPTSYPTNAPPPTSYPTNAPPPTKYPTQRFVLPEPTHFPTEFPTGDTNKGRISNPRRRS